MEVVNDVEGVNDVFANVGVDSDGDGGAFFKLALSFPGDGEGANNWAHQHSED